MAQTYETTVRSTQNGGSCTGWTNVTFDILYDKKIGASSPFPHVQELPYEREVWKKFPGTMSYRGSPTIFKYCFGPVGWNLDSDPNADLRLIGNLASKIRGHDFNPGVSLGEANESLGMIGSAAKRLASAASSLPKILPHSAWLEAVYGWLPLLSDLDEGAKFIVAALEVPRKQTYRAIAMTDGTPLSSAPSLWSAHGNVKRMKYAVAHMIEDDSNLAYTGIVDPLSVLWELTPYSFVADWFIPLGDYLNARNFLNSVKAFGVTGFVTRANVRSNWFYTADPNWKVLAEQTEKFVHHKRTVGLPSLPVPRFKPMDKVLSNWRHAADGLALAANVFGNRRLK